MNRIAVFQYEWDVRVYTLDLVTLLTEKGFYVDLFLKDCEDRLVDLDEMNKNNRIRIYDFSTDKSRKPPGFIYRNFWRVIGKLDQMFSLKGKLFRLFKRDISFKVLRKSSRVIGQNHYKCFIGIEKKGLIWAGLLNREYKYNIPVLYYSLELYVEDHPVRFTDPFFPRLRKLERRFHREAAATIIQDSMRAKVLFESNQVEKQPVILVPVSLRGNENPDKTRYFHDKFNLPAEKKIILYFGMINARYRLSREIAEQAEALDSDHLLVFHGYGKPQDIDALTGIAPGKVLVSTDLVSHDMITEVISAVDIGLVLYSSDNSNNKLTAFSSEKIARFSRSGIPVIAFDNENYRVLMKAYHCGELIGHINQLPRAVLRILQDYDSYRKNAFLAYKEYYCFDRHFENIKKFIDNDL